MSAFTNFIFCSVCNHWPYERFHQLHLQVFSKSSIFPTSIQLNGSFLGPSNSFVSTIVIIGVQTRHIRSLSNTFVNKMYQIKTKFVSKHCLFDSVYQIKTNLKHICLPKEGRRKEDRSIRNAVVQENRESIAERKKLE